MEDKIDGSRVFEENTGQKADQSDQAQPEPEKSCSKTYKAQEEVSGSRCPDRKKTFSDIDFSNRETSGFSSGSFGVVEGNKKRTGTEERQDQEAVSLRIFPRRHDMPQTSFLTGQNRHLVVVETRLHAFDGLKRKRDSFKEDDL